MDELIKQCAIEYWKALNEHSKTFDWVLNWKLYNKQKVLWDILEQLLELNK